MASARVAVPIITPRGRTARLLQPLDVNTTRNLSAGGIEARVWGMLWLLLKNKLGGDVN